MQGSDTGRTNLPSSLFVHGEPATALLLGRLRLKFWVAAILVLVVLGAPVYICASVKGFWQGGGGLLEDYTWWWYQFVSSPALLLFFFWLPAGLRTILNGLWKNGVLMLPPHRDGDGDPFLEFGAEFDKSYTRYLWPILGLAFSVLNTSIRMVPYEIQFLNWRGTTGAGAGDLVFAYTQLYWFVIYYFWFLLIIKGAVSAVWVRRLFDRFEVRVQGSHHDDVGGFSPLGSVVPKIGVLVAIIGFTVGVNYLEALTLTTFTPKEILLETNVVANLLIYLTAATTLFYAVVGSAHSAMREFKNKFVEQISDELENYVSHARNSLKSGYYQQRRSIDRLEKLSAFRRLVCELPEWPVGTRGIARFFTLVLVPLLTGIVVVVLDALLP